jgi:hypothetical protein
VIEGRARGGTDPVSLTFAASPETEMVIRMASDLVLRSLHSADDPEGDGA